MRAAVVIVAILLCGHALAQVPPLPGCRPDTDPDGGTWAQCGWRWDSDAKQTYVEVWRADGCYAGKRSQRQGKGKLNPPDGWWHPYRGACEPLPGETVSYRTVPCNDFGCAEPVWIDMVGQPLAHIYSTPDGHGCERGTSLMPWLSRCP